MLWYLQCFLIILVEHKVFLIVFTLSPFSFSISTSITVFQVPLHLRIILILCIVIVLSLLFFKFRKHFVKIWWVVAIKLIIIPHTEIHKGNKIFIFWYRDVKFYKFIYFTSTSLKIVFRHLECFISNWNEQIYTSFSQNFFGSISYLT